MIQQGNNLNYANLPLSISAGQIPGYSRASFVGQNPDIDTATLPETLWPVGGLYPWQSSANFIEILSTSAADSAAGTGMRVAWIYGLDANYNVISESVILNGLTPVQTTQRYLRVNRFLGVNAGSAGSNVGNVTARVTGAGPIQSFIPAQRGLSLTGVQTVPFGYTYFVFNIYAAMYPANPGVSTSVKINIRSRHSHANPCWITAVEVPILSQGSSALIVPNFPPPFGEGTDMEMLAVTFATAISDMGLMMLFQGALLNNREPFELPGPEPFLQGTL